MVLGIALPDFSGLGDVVGQGPEASDQVETKFLEELELHAGALS